MTQFYLGENSSTCNEKKRERERESERGKEREKDRLLTCRLSFVIEVTQSPVQLNFGLHGSEREREREKEREKARANLHDGRIVPWSWQISIDSSLKERPCVLFLLF